MQWVLRICLPDGVHVTLKPKGF